jgi:cell wall-associated NlpC family hydrolase
MYNVRNDSFSEENGVRNPSYIGRTFKIGERDCYSIIRDYYKKELKIELGDYFRDENWARKTPELYEQNYERENFIKVKTGSPVLEELKQHDCILFQFLDIPFPSHAAVYLGGGSILHHPRNGYSLIEKLSDPYLRRASYVLRHKSLWKS